jgi:AcrR family transcriptional regulator
VPRAGLTPAIVAAEGARVADEVGFEQLTLARVAERFGVAVPSLYKHVDGLQGLRDAVAVLSIRELGLALETGLHAAGGPSLAALADAYRGFAAAHPGRYQATVRAPDPADAEAVEASDAVLAVVLDVMATYGLEGPDAIDAIRTLRAALHGFVTLEAAGGFGLPRDVDRSFERLVGLMDAALRTWAPVAARRGSRSTDRPR